MGWCWLLWTVSGGVPYSSLIANRAVEHTSASVLNFIQISDSHIGFNKAPNPDATATFKTLLDRISARTPRRAFMVHTGDVSHLSREAESDTAHQLVKENRYRWTPTPPTTKRPTDFAAG